MPSLKSLNRKITSLKSTRKITKAMKMIAFTRYRKAHKALLESKPYQNELDQVLKKVTGLASTSGALATSRARIKKIRILLFTTERGLCGALNTNLLSHTLRFINEKKGTGVEIDILNCGKKGSDYFRKKGLSIPMTYEPYQKKVDTQHSISLGDRMLETYLKGECDEVYAAYNECRSIINLKPTLKRILPIELPEMGKIKDQTLLVEPEPEVVLDAVFRQMIYFFVYQSYLNTHASEHASRMTAMDSATNNAGTLIDKTVLFRNRMRQAAITRELTEIISGVESMSDK